MSAIAIVGMACRFAGAWDLQAYWALVEEGRHAFGPVPPDRWDAETFFDANPRATDKSCVHTGAFIDDIRSFPALTLGIPPRRVEVMDPQQRLAIEVCLQALEDGGYRPSDLPRRTGVYMGVTGTEFRSVIAQRVMVQMLASGAFGRAPQDPTVVAEAVERLVPGRPFTAPGVLANMVAAAVAQELDLHGPAYTVDSACASSLVAAADAVFQLRAGIVDAALAGGVYLCVTPEHHVAFSRIGAMSPTGRCLPFDARADGFVQGDGAGVVLLKRLDEAIRDGDRIYAVIHGIATNNDGRGEGPMAPVEAGQTEVIEAAWRDAGIDPARLGYLEAHGTGTQSGDLIEFRALMRALGQRCHGVALGSAKANVGHTMSAAAVAGLIRAALAVYSARLPSMAGFESSKPDLGLKGSPFHVPKATTRWAADTRIAAVSSFGFGGTNAHAVIGSWSGAETTTATPREQLEVVLLSAPDTVTLGALAARTADAVERDPCASAAGVSRAWAVRPRQAARLAVVARDRAELVARLRQAAAGQQRVGVRQGTPADSPKLAFLYPGQGTQRLGMLRAICDRFPVVAETLDRLERDLGDLLPVPLTHLLYPERRCKPVDEATARAHLTETANCQPVLLSVGVALTRLLESLGIRPHVMTGHSLGEITAAVAAGALSPVDGARFVARRGRAMAALPGDHGAMAAVMADARTTAGLLVDGAVIANLNHPRQTVVAGRTGAVSPVVTKASEAGIRAVRLEVSHAFHSPVLAGLDTEALVADLNLTAPTVTLASAIAGRPWRDAEDAREILRRHATSPVDFISALQQCREAGADLFLQVGAGGPLEAFVRGALGPVPVDVLTLAGTDDDDGGGWLLDTLARLWAHGVDMDVRAVAAPAQLASVPPSILPRESYWPVTEEAQLPIEIRRAKPRATPPEAPTSVVVEAPAAWSDPAEETVLGIIASVSAYPRDALRPDMALGEDLGFDSLMMNELAARLADAFPGFAATPQVMLPNAPTVGAVIEHVRAGRRAAARAPDEDAEDADDAPLTGYRPVWRCAPLPEEGNVPERAVKSGARVRVGGVDGHERIAVARAFEAAGAMPVENGAADLVVWLGHGGALASVSDVLVGAQLWPDLAGPLIELLDAQARIGARPDVLVTRRDGDPCGKALAGVVRAVAREWPEAVCKAVALGGGRQAGEVLVDEWRSADLSPDVRYDEAGRAVAGLEPALSVREAKEDQENWRPDPDQVVLVTGGTRGIGALFGARLAAAGARVLLAGRGQPSEQAAALIAAGGGRVAHVSVDVTDRDALARALAAHPPVTALVHCAGVLADGALGAVDPAQGAHARAVKVEGFLNAMAACGPSLRAVLGVGSWAGRFGNAHQVHYAAGNALMAGLAEHWPTTMAARPRVVVAEFGPWTSSRMAAAIPTAVQAAIRAEGVDFVGDKAGLAALESALGSGRGVLVMGRDLPPSLRTLRLETTLSVETHPFLADHVIRGTPVLPLAAVVDHVAEAARLEGPLEVTKLTLVKGVTVTGPVRLTTVVRADRMELRTGEEQALAWHARVRRHASEVKNLVGPDFSPADGGMPNDLPHRPELSDLLPPAEAPVPPDDGAPPDLDLDTFYREATFHGPRLRAIEHVDASGHDFIRGHVRTSRPTDWIPHSNRAAWTVDPLAVDGAMQLAAFLAYTRFGRAGLPVGLGRFVLLRPFPEGVVEVEVRLLDHHDDHFRGAFSWRDASGGLIAWAEDVVAELRATEPRAEPDLDIKREWVDPGAWPEVQALEHRLATAEASGIRNPYFTVHEGTARDTTVVGGRELINYSSYNYLGLSGDPRVLADVKAAIDRWGTSVSASRLASGERPFHRELEEALARCQGAEDALVFTAGHATNVNTIGHLLSARDLVLHDELVHDSALQGIKLSGASRCSFRHEDSSHLEAQLRALRRKFEKVLIVVEGVYSMAGDICDLPGYLELKERWGCLLMVDEAHSFGVVGRTGQGVGEHFGIDGSRVDIWMGTLSKSLASCGGWIAGSKRLVHYLRYTVPGFVYSAGLTPANGQAALSALRLMLFEPERVQRLQRNARLFHHALGERGLDTGLARGTSGLVPCITGDSIHALLLSQRLLDQGLNVQPIVYPAVASDAARLRFFLSCTHSDAQLLHSVEQTAAVLAAVRREQAT